jgi:hypothetical protein
MNKVMIYRKFDGGICYGYRGELYGFIHTFVKKSTIEKIMQGYFFHAVPPEGIEQRFPNGLDNYLIGHYTDQEGVVLYEKQESDQSKKEESNMTSEVVDFNKARMKQEMKNAIRYQADGMDKHYPGESMGAKFRRMLRMGQWKNDGFGNNMSMFIQGWIAAKGDWSVPDDQDEYDTLLGEVVTDYLEEYKDEKDPMEGREQMMAMALQRILQAIVDKVENQRPEDKDLH